ncbi:TPA: hypothetical protein ACSPK2_001146 [Pseudomonas aeruginosa]
MAGLIELVTGALIALGLFTRPAAFLGGLPQRLCDARGTPL